MAAVLPIPEPESCEKCILCIDKNRYSGTCVIDREHRMPLGNNKRSSDCKVFFADKAFDAFIKWAEERD